MATKAKPKRKARSGVHELLAPFCDDWDEGRYALSRPFEQGGRVYATDQKVCVRVPAAALPDVGPVERAPLANVLPFWWGPDDDDLFSWSKFPRIERRKFEVCPSCLAEYLNCDTCDGVGRIEQDVEQVLGGLKFDCAYLRRLKVLPGVEYDVNAPQDLLRVRFVVTGPDGARHAGQGLLMSMLR